VNPRRRFPRPRPVREHGARGFWLPLALALFHGCLRPAPDAGDGRPRTVPCPTLATACPEADQCYLPIDEQRHVGPYSCCGTSDGILVVCGQGNSGGQVSCCDRRQCNLRTGACCPSDLSPRGATCCSNVAQYEADAGRACCPDGELGYGTLCCRPDHESTDEQGNATCCRGRSGELGGPCSSATINVANGCCVGSTVCTATPASVPPPPGASQCCARESFFCEDSFTCCRTNIEQCVPSAALGVPHRFACESILSTVPNLGIPMIARDAGAHDP